MHYDWGYHSSDEQHVHVAFNGPKGRDELFDVTLYDPEVVVDVDTGETADEESLFALRQLLGYANAALKAGLEPLPVPDKVVEA